MSRSCSIESLISIEQQWKYITCKIWYIEAVSDIVISALAYTLLLIDSDFSSIIMINQQVLFGTFLSQGNIPLQALCYWNFFSPFEALLWLVRIEGNDYVMKPINFHSRRRAIQIEIVNYWHSRIFWGKADILYTKRIFLFATLYVRRDFI